MCLLLLIPINVSGIREFSLNVYEINLLLLCFITLFQKKSTHGFQNVVESLRMKLFSSDFFKCFSFSLRRRIDQVPRVWEHQFQPNFKFHIFAVFDFFAGSMILRSASLL